MYNDENGFIVRVMDAYLNNNSNFLLENVKKFNAARNSGDIGAISILG